MCIVVIVSPQGCLALPYAVANCGLVLGVVLVLISASMQLFSLHILSVCAAQVEHPSFYSVCQASVPRMTFMVDFAVVLQSFGVCTSYLIVISDLMPDVMDNFGVTESFWQDRPVWVLLGFAMCAPLSCFRKLDALRYTSGLSVLFVLFLMLMVFIFAIPGDGLHPCEGVPSDETCVGDKPMISVTTKTFQVFGIITNAYSCQSVSYCLRLMLTGIHLICVCMCSSFRMCSRWYTNYAILHKNE